MTVIKRREGWPTPCASGDLHYRLKGGSQASNCLAVAVYPTPTSHDRHGHCPSELRRTSPNLSAVASLLDTPAVHTAVVYPTPQTDHMGGGEMARKRLRKLQADGVLSSEETCGLMMRTVGKQLNPDWEEWLMAWPVGWTDLETPNIRLVWLDPSIDPADYGEIPRITNRRDNRPARVKAIGNGQFPLTAAVAFHWGLCVLQLLNKGEK